MGHAGADQHERLDRLEAEMLDTADELTDLRRRVLAAALENVEQPLVGVSCKATGLDEAGRTVLTTIVARDEQLLTIITAWEHDPLTHAYENTGKALGRW